MRKEVLLGVMALAILGIATVSTYAYLGKYRTYSSTTSWTETVETKGLQSLWARFQANACGRGLKPGIRSLSVEVSEEFKERVLSIAEEDPDVQELLNEGYNVTGIRPTVKAVVQGNGDVTIKATGAVVVMRKEKGWACVQVDLEAEKVTRIVVVSARVIEKSP